MHRTLTLLALFSLGSAAVAQVPEVLLSAQHEEMCAVRVGDPMPGLTLLDPKGEQVELKASYGAKATVVAVVGYEHWMNQQLLADLPRDVGAVYGTRGVATVLINTGDNASEELRQGLATTTLADPDGEQLAKLGSGRMPRVYVLDAGGKIRWFDIEYSRSTRRELRQTLTTLVGEN